MTPEKLPSNVVSQLTERLSNEFKAYYFYRSATNWCKNVGYFKASEFFAKESEDELAHAKKIEDYLTDWNVTPMLPVIDKPVLEFSCLCDVLDQAYEMEYELYEAYEETSMNIFKIGDLCVFDFLQFFRTAQKDAVAEYSDKLNMLDGVEPGDKFQLLMLEKKLF